MSYSRRQFITATAAAVFGFSSGCGTILYPERIGQPSGPLDWKVVALNTLGLLLFVVPGVIAFAVDFHNGTIYLPAQQYPHASANAPQQRELATLHVPPERLSRERIEQVVSQRAEQAVHLEPGRYRAQPLDHVSQFWFAHDSLVEEPGQRVPG